MSQTVYRLKVFVCLLLLWERLRTNIVHHTPVAPSDRTGPFFVASNVARYSAFNRCIAWKYASLAIQFPVVESGIQ